jgi:hypothetical protein
MKVKIPLRVVVPKVKPWEGEEKLVQEVHNFVL